MVRRTADRGDQLALIYVNRRACVVRHVLIGCRLPGRFRAVNRRTPMATDDNTKSPPPNDLSRRDMLKGASVGAAAVGLSATGPASAQAQAGPTIPKNPYGGRPGGGFSLPPYFKPTPSITGSRANYFPLSETLGSDEMRISFVGSTPWPPRRDQAGTAIMVEL